MTNWKYKVDFSSFYRDEDLSLSEKGVLVAKKLERLPIQDDDLKDLIEDFKCIIKEDIVDDLEVFTPTQDFDARMCDLYDWADDNRVWINTY